MGIFHYPAWVDDNELFHRLDGTIGLVALEDAVVFQFPSWNGIRYDEKLTSKLKSYAKKLVIYVHDIDALLFGFLKGDGLKGYMLRIVAMLEKADLMVLASPKLYEHLK